MWINLERGCEMRSGQSSGTAMLADLANCVARLLGSLSDMNGEEAAQLLPSMSAVVAQVESLRLGLIARVDSSGIWQRDESTTPASWLREHDNLDHRGATTDLRTARLIASYPAARAAVECGCISREHLDTIASIGLSTPSRRDALGDFLEIFLDIGSSCPPTALRRVMRAWAEQVDPIATAKDQEEAHRRRYFNVSRLADGVFVEGFFDHEQGSKILAALNAAMAKARRTSRAETDHATLPPPSTSQQRADAFISGIIDPLLNSDHLPSSGGSRASVTVLVPLERLEKPCGVNSRAAVTPRLAEGADARDASEQLEHASPLVSVSNGPESAVLSATAAQRMTCDCSIHRLVLSPDGLPLDVGRTMRTFPPHMRKALNVRDGGCVFPHCDRPPGWAEAHHIVHWAQGGDTSLENSVLLCSKHHHRVHAEGLQVEIGPDGRGRVVLGTQAFLGPRPREKLRL